MLTQCSGVRNQFIYAHVQTGALHDTALDVQTGGSGSLAVESTSSTHARIAGAQIIAVQLITQFEGTIIVTPGAPLTP